MKETDVPEVVEDVKWVKATSPGTPTKSLIRAAIALNASGGKARSKGAN